MSLNEPPRPRPTLGKEDIDKHSKHASFAARVSLGLKHDTRHGRLERRGRRRPRAADGDRKQHRGLSMFSLDDANVDIGFVGVETLSRLLPSKNRVFKDYGPHLTKKMVHDALHSDLQKSRVEIATEADDMVGPQYDSDILLALPCDARVKLQEEFGND